MKSKWERVLERELFWLISFGIEYGCLRWVLNTGHLAATFAWCLASISTVVVYRHPVKH